MTYSFLMFNCVWVFPFCVVLYFYVVHFCFLACLTWLFSGLFFLVSFGLHWRPFALFERLTHLLMGLNILVVLTYISVFSLKYWAKESKNNTFIFIRADTQEERCNCEHHCVTTIINRLLHSILSTWPMPILRFLSWKLHAYTYLDLKHSLCM